MCACHFTLAITGEICGPCRAAGGDALTTEKPASTPTTA